MARSFRLFNKKTFPTDPSDFVSAASLGPRRPPRFTYKSMTDGSPRWPRPAHTLTGSRPLYPAPAHDRRSALDPGRTVPHPSGPILTISRQNRRPPALFRIAAVSLRRMTQKGRGQRFALQLGAPSARMGSAFGAAGTDLLRKSVAAASAPLLGHMSQRHRQSIRKRASVTRFCQKWSKLARGARGTVRPGRVRI